MRYVTFLTPWGIQQATDFVVFFFGVWRGQEESRPKTRNERDAPRERQRNTQDMKRERERKREETNPEQESDRLSCRLFFANRNVTFQRASSGKSRELSRHDLRERKYYDGRGEGEGGGVMAGGEKRGTLAVFAAKTAVCSTRAFINMHLHGAGRGQKKNSHHIKKMLTSRNAKIHAISLLDSQHAALLKKNVAWCNLIIVAGLVIITFFHLQHSIPRRPLSPSKSVLPRHPKRFAPAAPFLAQLGPSTISTNEFDSLVRTFFASPWKHFSEIKQNRSVVACMGQQPDSHSRIPNRSVVACMGQQPDSHCRIPKPPSPHSFFVFRLGS